MAEPTIYENKLITKLKELEINAEPQYNDGHKSVDIFIPKANLIIEVDGSHHHSDSNQALTDLLRTMYSMKEGKITLRIPNKLVDNNINDCASLIKKIVIHLEEEKKVSEKIKQTDKKQEINKEELGLFFKSIKKEFESLVKESQILIEEKQKREKEEQIKKTVITSTIIITLLLIGTIFYFDIPEFNLIPIFEKSTSDVNIKNTEPTQIPTIEDNKLRFYDFKKDGVYDTFKVFNKLNNDLTINIFYKQSVNKRGNPTIYHESQKTITILSQQFITLQGEQGYNSPYNTQIVKESISYEIVI